MGAEPPRGRCTGCGSDPAVLPAAGAEIPPVAQQEHPSVYMFRRPADSHVKLHDSDHHRAVYHIECEGDHLQLEGRLRAACSGHGQKEDLSSDIQKI